MATMKVNEDKTVELEITVGADEFKSAVDAAFKKNAKRIQVPGFRRGKAPRKMIEKMYGEGVFYEEAVNNTFPAAYQAAVQETGIEPVDRANIEVGEVGADGYTFKATVTVKPEVSIEDYKGIAVEKVIAQTTDEDVDAEIERRREQNARLLTIEDRAAQSGDTAVIDFEGFMDGAPFDGGKAEDYPLNLGSNTFIPGFEEQVAGHSTGESFDVNVTFPEDYQVDELKGKAVVFKCKLKEIKGKELPELDDEFVKDISEFDTLAQLKDDIRKKLQERKEAQSDNAVEEKLLNTIGEKVQGDIPECMYETRIDEMLHDFEHRLQAQGLDLNTYLQYTGMELESFRKTFRDQAQSQVKTRLGLEKIIELEKLEASNDEIEAEFLKLSQQHNMDIDKIKSLVPVSDVTRSLTTNKAIDIVKDNAVINEVKETAEPAQEK